MTLSITVLLFSGFLFLSITTISGKKLTDFQSYSEKTNIVIELHIDEIDYNEVNVLSDSDKKRISGFDTGVSGIYLNSIFIPSNILGKSEKLCFTDLSVSDLNVYASVGITYDQKIADERICLDVGKTDFRHQFENAQVSENFYNPFLYPFDTRTLKFDLAFTMTIIGEDGEEKENLSFVEVKVIDTPPRWEKDITPLPIQTTGKKGIQVNLTLTRPIIYRTLSTILPFTTAIGIIIVMFFSSRDDFFQIAFGLLLSLWGMREVLVPSQINYPTLVNSIILLLYLFLGIVMLIKFYLVVQENSVIEKPSHKGGKKKNNGVEKTVSLFAKFKANLSKVLLVRDVEKRTKSSNTAITSNKNTNISKAKKANKLDRSKKKTKQTNKRSLSTKRDKT